MICFSDKCFLSFIVCSVFFLLLLLQIIASMSTARNALVHEPFATDFHGRRAFFQSPPVDDGIVIRIGRPDDAVLHSGFDDARRFLRTRWCAQKRVVVENVLTLQLALKLRLVQTRRVFEVGHHPAARRPRRVERVRLRVLRVYVVSHRQSIGTDTNKYPERARACVCNPRYRPTDRRRPPASRPERSPLFRTGQPLQRREKETRREHETQTRA